MFLTVLLLWGFVCLDPGGRMRSFELTTIDFRYRQYSRPTPRTNDIVIIDVSDESIKRLEPQFGRWPWPRAIHTEVLKYLSAAGAKVVGFDIIFSEQSRRQEIDHSLIRDLNVLAENIDRPAVLEDLKKKLKDLDTRRDDDVFAEAVKTAGNVVQAIYFDLSGEHDGTAGHERYEDSQIIETDLKKSGLHLEGIPFVPAASQVTLPYPTLMERSLGMGHINFFPDEDGVCRRYYPLISFNGKNELYPSFALAMAAAFMGIQKQEIRFADDRIIMGNSFIPLNHDGSVLINYQGGSMAETGEKTLRYRSFYSYLPYHEVLASAQLKRSGLTPVVPPDVFKDRIVLIGVTAAGLKDLRSTPIHPTLPGIEITANSIDNILSQRFLKTLAPRYENVYLLFLTLIAVLISLRLSSIRGFLCFMLYGLSILAAHWILFGKGFILPLAAPVILIIGAYISGIIVKYIISEKDKRFLKYAFGHYMSHAVVNEILRTPEKLKLGGERKYLTVMFTDIEKCTVLSEQLSPEDFTRLINEYFTRMTRCIFKTGGILDKFVGDGMSAEWNIPQEKPDHAAAACEAALWMLDELKLFNEKNRRENRPEIRMRIGIMTGDMIVGNMGSDNIFDYTVCGVNANTSSRLETLNKEFGTRVLVSGTTYLETRKFFPEKYLFRKIANVVVIGRTEPLEVFEIVGWKDRITQDKMRAILKFNYGFSLYVGGQFSDAVKAFEETLEVDPDDGPAKTYSRLCRELKDSPYPPDWEGSYYQKSK